MSSFTHSFLVAPSKNEQERIVDFLNATTARIDEALSLNRIQINELRLYKQSLITETVTRGLDPDAPMKDSGVDWIGQIPANWTLNRIKNICELNPPCAQYPKRDAVISYAPMECVKNGYLEAKEAQYSDLSTGLTYFADGDIIMAKVTPCFENGNIAVAEKLTGGIAFGSSELFVFRPRKIFTRWLFYFLQNQAFVELCKSTMTGTGGLKRVSPSFIREFVLAVPSVTEQELIANYLDKKCGKIDALISLKQSKIEKLTRYRQSLIYEYVTGKKEAP